MPDKSAIILQVIIALFSLVTGLATGLIVTFYGNKLNQKNKKETRFDIIHTATNEIKKYSQKTKSAGESRDLLEYIIYKLPVRVNEISNERSKFQNSKKLIVDRANFFAILNICIFLFQIFFYQVLDLQPIYFLLAFTAIFIVICSSIILEIFLIVPLFKNIMVYIKKMKSLNEDIEKIKSIKAINSISKEELIEFIRQRKIIGYGTTIQDIKDELEMFDIKSADSDIIRAHLNIFFTDDPKEKREILQMFYLDGKTHESFDELSDKQILVFFDTVKNNIENKPKAIRSFLSLYYPESEERQGFLNAYFNDGKFHESFEEISDEDILKIFETINKEMEFQKSGEK